MKKQWLSLGLFLCILGGCAKVPPSATQLANSKDLKEDKSIVTNAEAYEIIDMEGEEQYKSGFNRFQLKLLKLSDVQKQAYLWFDSKAEWPKVFDEFFDAESILKQGLNPGLGIRALHFEGITGKGIGIAIMGPAKIVWHQEYERNTRLYERLGCSNMTAQVEGTAMASFAVGKKAGTAPGASLYYIASTFEEELKRGYETDLGVMAKGIRRILGFNEELSDSNKIRVICIPHKYTSEDLNAEEADRAREEAKEAGICILSPNSLADYGIELLGLGREQNKNPDELSSYKPAISWSEEFYADPASFQKENLLLVPMDGRTFAGNTGNNETTGKEVYTYSSVGLASEPYAWMAGLYALCAQVKPTLTPDEFFYLAKSTGDVLPIDGYSLETVVNPQRLIQVLKKQQEG